jgi:hypothetical protein
MTTNVRDSKASEVACDSRWTWDLRPHGVQQQVVLDDSGYEKMVTAHGCVAMFAGNSVIIEQWKQAFATASDKSKTVDWGNLPVNGMAISMVKIGTGQIVFEFGHEISLPQASFAGSGSYAAASCWQQNQCAKTAVETAKGSDMHTGGTVRYMQVLDGVGNLVNDMPFSNLVPQFLQRGKFMANINSPVTFTDVAANDEELQKAMLAAVAQGKGPTAPCDAVFNEWPEAEKRKLVSAMEALFEQ